MNAQLRSLFPKFKLLATHRGAEGRIEMARKALSEPFLAAVVQIDADDASEIGYMPVAFLHEGNAHLSLPLVTAGLVVTDGRSRL